MFTRTSRAKRRIGAAVLAALVGSLLAFASPASSLAGAAATTERLAGVNRYDTAAKVALDARWGTGAAEPITVVNGENFPDGLAAAALGSRILLVKADSVPAETEAAIKKIEADGAGNDGVGIITVVGGPGAVSSSVVEALDAMNGAQVVRRLSGADRYATALAVAKDISATPADVILATGTDFPDALAAGPLALDKSAPIVLSQGASLDPALKAYLAPATTLNVFIVGGTGVVPQSIEDELRAMGKQVKRLAGANRDATAVAVATEMGANGNASAILVNRNGFADALAAGPFANHVKVEGSILLTGADSIPADTAAWHAGNCLALGKNTSAAPNPAGEIYAIGGTGVISDTVLAGAGAASKCTTPTYTATVATTVASQSTYEISGNGPALGKGVTLTAKPGSAADGVADWTIVLADAAQPAATAAVTAANTLTVTFPTIGGGGLSQAAFVSTFNSLPQASALFTASAYSIEAPVAYTDLDTAGASTTVTRVAGKLNQTLTLTFSEAVDDNAGVGVGNTLDATDLTGLPALTGGVLVSNPPLGTVGTSTSLTVTITGITAAPIVAGVTKITAVAGFSSAHGAGVSSGAAGVTIS